MHAAALWFLLQGGGYGLADAMLVGDALSQVRNPPVAPAPVIETRRGPSGRVRGFRMGPAATPVVIPAQPTGSSSGIDVEN